MYDIINYVQCTHEQHLAILNLRNLDVVRKWMVDSTVITEDSHFAFVNKLKEDKGRLFFAVFKDGNLIGTYNLTKIQDGIWERGIIASPLTQGKGMTQNWERIILLRLLLHNVKYITAKVQIENARSQSYHKKIGFIESLRDKEYIYYKMDISMVNEINRDGFVVNQFRFKDFTTLSIGEKKMVLDWRNTESIRKWMYNKEEIDLESHSKFIDSLRDRDDRYYWLVTDLNNDYLGVVNVTSVDRDNDRAELGLYLNPDTSMMGFYFVRECYYFFFCVLNIGKLYCSVDKDNKSAMLLDEFFGCRFTEKKIIDNGTQKDEYLVSTNLTRNQFEKNYSLTFKDYILFVRNKQKENN